MSGAAARSLGNLPAERNTLIGRSDEVAEARRLLTSARVLTLVGPGGVGKTRLTLEIARRARAAFAGGVWFVGLAELSQPDLIASSVARVLAGSAGRRKSDVAELIADRQVLLVLDNCEHLTEACAEFVDELLIRCADLKVLASSREALRIPGEALLPVAPLAVPPLGLQGAPGSSARYPAVALFVARASALDPTFDLGKHEQLIVEMCQRLDGLPLAIELAAAATNVMPMDALLARVGDTFAPEVGRRRGTPQRQQSLRATMQYSHDLCSREAQTLWARMSIFRGGAPLEAVERVCADDDLRPEDIWSALGELVEKSVLVFDGSRYAMLETIRAFGYDQLVESGSAAAVRVAHRNYYSDIAVELEAGWFGPEQPSLLDSLLNEQANLRAALEYCLSEPGQIGQGMRMATQLYGYWLGSGLPSEGRAWLDRLLGVGGAPVEERLSALWVCGFFTAIDGDITRARALLDECLLLATERGDRAIAGHARSARGIAELLAGNEELAVSDLRTAVELERAGVPGNPFLTQALVDLGSALCFAGRIPEAIDVLEDARAICADRGEQYLLSWTSTLLGLAAFLEGHYDDAAGRCREGLRLKRALEDLLGMGWCVEVLAWIALSNGDPERAARLLGANVALSEPLGHHLSSLPRLVEMHEQQVALTREALGSRAFSSFSKAGAELSRDELLAYALGETELPVLDDLSALDHLPLTPREREIASLVAEGLTNKAIAAKLVIAHRTVDTHVEHILTKLEFTNRSQVAALLGASAVPATRD